MTARRLALSLLVLPAFAAAGASPVRGLPGSVSFERLKAMYEAASEAPSPDELRGWLAGSEVPQPNPAGWSRAYPAVLIGEPTGESWRLFRFVCRACAGTEFRELRAPFVDRLRALVAGRDWTFGRPEFAAEEVRFDCSEPPQRFSLRKAGPWILQKGVEKDRVSYAVYFRDVTPPAR